MTDEHDDRQKTTPPDFVRYLNVRSASGVSFAPDGRRLTFLTDITGVAEVWSVAVTPANVTNAEKQGGALPWPEQLTFGGERIVGAAFSPVADQLIVGSDVGGNERTQLFLMSGDGAMTGTTLTPLTSQPDVIHIFGGWQEDGSASSGWSPDGARIVYASNARDARFFDIYERAVDDLDTAPRLLLQHDGTNYPAGYSPDGRLVLVQRFESNVRNTLLLVDTATGAVRQLTPEVADAAVGPARHIAPQWSPDGRGFYLLSDRERSLSLPGLARPDHC